MHVNTGFSCVAASVTVPVTASVAVVSPSVTAVDAAVDAVVSPP